MQLADGNGSINKPSSDKVGGNRTSAQSNVVGSGIRTFFREVVDEEFYTIVGSF
jgi:hypothetical protein